MKRSVVAITKEKLCPICQRQFRRSHRANQFHRGGGQPHGDQIYCSDACRQKAYRRAFVHDDVGSSLRASSAAGGIAVRLPDRVLEPVERISEILFGLIMALTITGAVSVATSDHFQIRTMLWAALGCNLAWGIIDGGMYLMARLGERGRNAIIARAVRETSNREDAHRIIADELPSLLGSIFQPAQLELIRERINQMPASDLRPGLTGRDWLGAFGVCILVVLSRFPVVIPFIVFGDARLALRTSNAFAVVLLFICGILFARHAGLWPWATGVIMVAIGAALVSVAIALGG